MQIRTRFTNEMNEASAIKVSIRDSLVRYSIELAEDINDYYQIMTQFAPTDEERPCTIE
jgi:hypothetical protein